MNLGKRLMDDRIVGVGVIGAGNMARDMCSAFAKNRGFRLCSMYDVERERACALAERYSARVAESLDELLDDPSLELIYISAPPQHHHALFLKALGAKKHVFCEKPLCLTNEEAHEMAAASSRAEKVGLVTAINFPTAFIPALKAIKLKIQKGYLGELRRIDLSLHFPQWPRRFLPFTKDSWIAQKGMGGPLREISTHFFFVLLHLFDDPELVQRVIAKVGYSKGAEELSEVSTTGIMELKGHVYLQLDLLANYAGPDERICMSFHGSRGSLHLENFQFLRMHDEEEQRGLETSKVVDPQAFMDSAPVVEELRKAIVGLKHSLVPIAMGQATQTILNAVLESNGNWVRL